MDAHKPSRLMSTVEFVHVPAPRCRLGAGLHPCGLRTGGAILWCSAWPLGRVGA